MDFLKIVEQVKEVVELIDGKDDAVLIALESISKLSFVPSSIGVAVALVKKYEPVIISAILQAIAVAENLSNAAVAVTSQTLSGSEKLEVAIREVSESVNNAPAIINSAVSLINSIIKG